MTFRFIPSRAGWPLALALAAGCGAIDDPNGANGSGNGSNGGNGGNGTPSCPAALPEAAVGCASPECSATTGDRRVAEATPTRAESGRWLVVLTAADAFLEDEPSAGDLTVNLGLEVPGALVPERTDRPALGGWLSAQPPELRARVQTHRARVAAEAALRAGARERFAPIDHVLGGTGARAIRRPGEARQTTSCSADAPACGADAICLIAVGQTDGTCETQLALGIQNDVSRPDAALPVEARVRVVTDSVAVLTDLRDTVTDDDVNELVRRFDTHIAPLDHAFFGEPVDATGRDFDGNGVVMIVLTEEVATLDPNLVGFFTSDDLRDPNGANGLPWSNGADVLFMRPPGPSVSLDQLSGTIAHEYQHLINYFTKVIQLQSEPERVWLDEGVSSFAEDLTGYGVDAFENVALYLDAVPLTTLISGPDTSERRGMAHLLVRYLFEQSGGASFPGAGEVADGGGVAAVRRLVTAADTGTELFSARETGREYSQWLEDLMVTMALDGTSIPDVSCNPGFQLEDPTTSTFTGLQRGIDLRSSIPGTGIVLQGPTVDPYAAAEALPFTGNGGEIRSLVLTADSAELSLATDVQNAENFELGFRVIVAE